MSVPFLLKFSVDKLNEYQAVTHGEEMLTLVTASDTILTVASSLLIGCKDVISSFNTAYCLEYRPWF